MTLIYLMLYFAAGIFFGLAAGGVLVKRLNLVALGLLCWVVVEFLQTAQKL